jgi:hypothetical protein
MDNGATVRIRAFVRGCGAEGMKIEWRPTGEPDFGGHIERLIGIDANAPRSIDHAASPSTLGD